jgi:hypothetical protein
MFADDTSVLQSASSICELNTRLKCTASDGWSAWADINNIALNTTKTKSIFITIHIRNLIFYKILHLISL